MKARSLYMLLNFLGGKLKAKKGVLFIYLFLLEGPSKYYGCNLSKKKKKIMVANLISLFCSQRKRGVGQEIKNQDWLAFFNF